jgi:hypothetical protein
MMLHESLWPFWECFPQNLGERRRVGRGVIDIGVGGDDRLDPSADPVCRFALFNPDRRKQLANVAWADLGTVRSPMVG